jgi:ACS family hexuronate transporter-like MFS transporter
LSSPFAALGYRRLRWFLTAWITVSTILNYIDRQTLSIVAPLLRDEFGLSNRDYSHIVNAFLVSYTVMYTVGGRIVDWIGERLGMAACIIWWSLATIAHSLAQGALSLGVFRFLLGIGEPANYPAALRATTSWFPKSERGLPIAIYSSGSAVGAVLAPPMIAWITVRYGWRYAFVIPGALGLLWVIVWLFAYRRPEQYPQISAQDLAWRAEENPMAASLGERERPDRWRDLLRDRKVLGIVLARMIADPVWYFYLFWIPEYLKRERGFSLADIGLYAWIPFVAAGLGGMLGGVASDRLIQRGRAPSAARQRILYLAAAVAPAGMLTSVTASPWVALFLIAVVAFVCFCWFINTAALVSDVFPGRVVGSVQGLMGTSGSGGGILFTAMAGFLLDHFSYTPVFVLVGCMHVVASLILWSLFREKRV